MTLPETEVQRLIRFAHFHTRKIENPQIREEVMQEILLKAVRVCATGKWDPEQASMVALLAPKISVCVRSAALKCAVGMSGKSSMRTAPVMGQINEELDAESGRSEAESWRKILDAPKAAVPDKLRPKFEHMCLEYNFKRAKRFATPALREYLEDIRDS
jgi:hypothetical protein